MSGFASKLSAVGNKGWKDLQSLWGEPKTTLTSADTSPGEKSSLLGRSSYGSGDESSKSHLLGDENESWGEWSHASDWSSTKIKTNKSDWSAGNEDDLEAWLNDDTSALSTPGKSKNKKKINDSLDSWKGSDSSGTPSSGKYSSSSSSKSKKKSHKSSAGVSLSDGWDNAEYGYNATASKQKEPLVGNLLDLEDGIGVTKTAAGNGLDNEVWMAESDDSNDKWQTLDGGGDNKIR